MIGRDFDILVEDSMNNSYVCYWGTWCWGREHNMPSFWSHLLDQERMMPVDDFHRLRSVL